MQQDVYADLLFLINFSMDYLCLYICTKVMHRPQRTLRMLLSASIGGIYSVLALFFLLDPIISLIIDLSVCLIMSAIVFAEKGRPLSSTLLCAFLYLGISMMSGGCMTAIFNLLNRFKLPIEGVSEDGISTYLFALLAAIAGLISLKSGQMISRRSTVNECELNITLSSKSLTLHAISDTGNLIKDPLSGKCVIIIDRALLSKITDINIFDEFAKGKIPKMSHGGSFRLIPINTAAGRSMLVAAKADGLSVTIEKRGRKQNVEIDALIAPSEIKNSAEGYGAIIPAEILKSI